MVLLVAGLVLFTTFSLIKVSTLESFNPDLRRIGINIGPDNSLSPLANNQTSNPTQEEGGAVSDIIVASDSLNIDASADIDSEGDTPLYIE